jgi:hypothetical protein
MTTTRGWQFCHSSTTVRHLDSLLPVSRAQRFVLSCKTPFRDSKDLFVRPILKSAEITQDLTCHSQDYEGYRLFSLTDNPRTIEHGARCQNRFGSAIHSGILIKPASSAPAACHRFYHFSHQYIVVFRTLANAMHNIRHKDSPIV